MTDEGVRHVRDVLASDLAWFEAHREELCREYEGRFVAIVEGRVIDSDRDFSALADRVFGDGGMRPVLMPKVAREPRVVRLRSPRRSRA